MVSKDSCFWSWTDEKINNSFHNPRTITFAWVDSGWNKYSFFYYRFFWFRFFLFRCYCYVITTVPSNSSSQHLSTIKILRAWAILNSLKIFAQIWISVRKTMCKVNTIIIINKLTGEGQSIVTFIWETVPSRLIFDIVLIIFYISTSTIPSNIFIFALVYTIWKNSHTWII